jgi:Cu/Ag efflux pump CusA
VSELDLRLKTSAAVAEIYADIPQPRYAGLPAAIGIGQPINHRIDHLLSGVRAQISKFMGTTWTLRGRAEALRQRLSVLRHRGPGSQKTGADTANQNKWTTTKPLACPICWPSCKC